jgi:hypothetical protein
VVLPSEFVVVIVAVCEVVPAGHLWASAKDANEAVERPTRKSIETTPFSTSIFMVIFLVDGSKVRQHITDDS